MEQCEAVSYLWYGPWAVLAATCVIYLFLNAKLSRQNAEGLRIVDKLVEQSAELEDLLRRLKEETERLEQEIK